MRIGLFGGTFDPIHLGHLILAETCREVCRLDEVWFIPAGQPPHKPTDATSPSQARREMVEFAIAGHGQFRIQDLELRREGPSYTVDTLRALTSQEADHEFFLMMGADSLRDLPTWREPAEILRMARLIAVSRSGHTIPDTNAFGQIDGQPVGDRVELVTMPDIGIDSTSLRQRIQRGQSIRFQVPRAVEVYILNNQLYVTSEPD